MKQYRIMKYYNHYTIQVKRRQDLWINIGDKDSLEDAIKSVEFLKADDAFIPRVVYSD